MEKKKNIFDRRKFYNQDDSGKVFLLTLLFQLLVSLLLGMFVSQIAESSGLTTKEVVTEYGIDEETGKLKILKQKVNEKSLPPNVDILKLIYPYLVETKTDYNKLTDEELEKEKQRLLKELKEKESANRKNKSQNKM